MAPTARLADPSDLGLVQSLTYAAYRPYVTLLGGEPLPMTDDYAARIAARQVSILSSHGTPVGVMVLEPEPDTLLIVSLALHPAHQRQGFGRWMLDYAENHARAAGLHELRLYTNAKLERNLAIYRQAGFQEVGRRLHHGRTGWMLVDMARPVRSSR